MSKSLAKKLLFSVVSLIVVTSVVVILVNRGDNSAPVELPSEVATSTTTTDPEAVDETDAEMEEEPAETEETEEVDPGPTVPETDPEAVDETDAEMEEEPAETEETEEVDPGPTVPETDPEAVDETDAEMEEEPAETEETEEVDPGPTVPETDPEAVDETDAEMEEEPAETEETEEVDPGPTVPETDPEAVDETDAEMEEEPAETEETSEDSQYEYHSCVTHAGIWCLLADGNWRAKRPSYAGIEVGDVQVCGELEVIEVGAWGDSLECVHYDVSQEQLEIFPYNCGPIGPGGFATLTEHLERVFERPVMGPQGYCGFMSSWYYRPFSEWLEDNNGENGMYVLCNQRDWFELRSQQPACLHPDTDPSSLNPFQYIGLPETPENRKVDRSHDPQVQKPYLNYDLVVLRKFCDRYPVAEPCERILGTQN